MENLPKAAFYDFFRNKGNTAPIAEKADRNFTIKNIVADNASPKAVHHRLYYFAIGHVFKQLDKKSIFEYTVEESGQKKGETIINAFKNISEDKFTFEFAEALKKLLSDIRNINSHYVHEFSVLKLPDEDNDITLFLKEAFELAAIHIYIKKKKKTYAEFKESKTKDKELVSFLCERFYPINDTNKNKSSEQIEKLQKYKDLKAEFNRKSKNQAIESLLFIKNPSNFDWLLNETHNIFEIEAGRYLSFVGSMFLMSMFLYKGEANQLISKVRGFKQNDDDTKRSKRDLFSFYSKRFSSQDIDSEEANLIKFRDIVQYLNRYPTAWKSEIEKPQQKANAVSNLLKEKIIDMEIGRCYFTSDEKDKHKNNDKFKLFAKYKIFEKFPLGKKFKKEYEKEYKKGSFSGYEIESYNFEIDTTKEYKNALQKEKDILNSRYYNQKKHDDTKETIRKQEGIENKDTQKLKMRIAKNLLYVSYGRNNDRFLEFAARFLAETNYFGSDAQFKMYQYFDPKEQNDALKNKNLTKKQTDKLKYHQGKTYDYLTFGEHKQKYPAWDTPFVIENNSFHVKVNLMIDGAIVTKIVYVNRKVLIYFLEHALYSKKIENAGEELLSDYYKAYRTDFSQNLHILETQNSISTEQKTEFKKMLPKRLLHQYAPPLESTKKSALAELLKTAKKSEERYNELLNKVKQEEIEAKQRFPEDDIRLVEYFLNKNKGKQFKLRFIRKAWNLMYFRDKYFEQLKNADKHHKRFHITKDEYDHFAKWLFAFDEVPVYKTLLREMFTEKGFLENTEFKYLFEASNSLDMMYQQTKSLYSEWLKSDSSLKNTENSHTLGKYKEIFDDQTFLINISYFVKFLIQNDKIKTSTDRKHILYQSFENHKHLIEEYYYKNQLQAAEYKAFRKLHKQLNTTKLEDGLLYQMAMYYLNTDKEIAQKAAAKVDKLLSQDVVFNVPDANKNELFKLTIPFNKLMSYQELLAHKEFQEEEFKNSFLSNMFVYLETVSKERETDENKIEKEVKELIYNKKPRKELRFEDLYKLNNHIINTSSRFTKVVLEMEAFFVGAKEIVINKAHKKINNRIVYIMIPDLVTYFSADERNGAFHFLVPKKRYKVLLKEIEKKFLKNEIKNNPANFDSLNSELKALCMTFLDAAHDEYYESKDRSKDKKKNKEDAIKKYFDQIIKKR